MKEVLGHDKLQVCLTVLSFFYCVFMLNEAARVWWITLFPTDVSQAHVHIEKQLSSHLEPRIFFRGAGMFPALVKSINSVKHLIISLRLWSMHCWDLGACKWRDLELWLTSLAEWEVCYDWSVADGGFFFWPFDGCQGWNALKRHFLT